MPGDLSVTALYTAGVWAWAELPMAELFASQESRRVFRVTNGALDLARLAKRDVPHLPTTLLHRHAMIDHLVRAAAPRAVLELAAGLSRRGAAFTADPNLDYTEVDLPPVVAKKRALLERTEAGRAVLDRPGLRLVGADAQAAPLEPLVRPGVPLLVVAEGFLVYLAAPAQRALFARVAALAKRASEVRWVFDLVPPSEEPPPGVVGRVLGAALERATGGQSFAREPRTAADIVGDLRAAGFTSVETARSERAAAAWSLPHPDARTRNVIFACSTATPFPGHLFS